MYRIGKLECNEVYGVNIWAEVPSQITCSSLKEAYEVLATLGDNYFIRISY